MFKRDKIFYSACGLTGAGLILALLGYELSLLFLVVAYLLRPALHEFGLARQLVDERQHEIYARSGNLAFVVIMAGLVGMTIWRIAEGSRTGEMYTLIGIGVAARALSGLIMHGEYRKAGVLIISAAGVYLSLLVLMVEGFSMASAVGALIGLVIIGFGQLAWRFPRVIAILMGVIAALVIVIFRLHEFRRGDMEGWLFFVIPLVTSSLCLYLGGRSEDEFVSARVRTVAFGSLGVVTTIVFALIIIGGSDEVQSTSTTVQLSQEEMTEVEGILCRGSIEYHSDGSLEYCSLAREDTLSGQALPAGTGVHFTEDGVFDWCFLQQNTTIQAIPCLGDEHNFMTTFHPNGQLKTAWMAEDEVIQGIPCSKFRFLSAVFAGFHGKPGATDFHDNGQLKYCELSENTVIDGRRFRRGEAVKFDRDGKLIAKN